jgi:hypothetical protein
MQWTLAAHRVQRSMVLAMAGLKAVIRLLDTAERASGVVLEVRSRVEPRHMEPRRMVRIGKL